MKQLKQILRSKKRLDTKYELISDMIEEAKKEGFDKAKAHYQVGDK